MPQTFRDAVRITRALGFRYLWIDSLCIIQDDLADWETEAENMGRIYHKSSLTISAVIATSADTGCFPEYSEQRNWPCFVGAMHCDPQTPKHAPHDEKLYARAPASDLQKQNDSFRPRGPLDSCGWVLQEEVFSSRLLSFCHQGIFWECLETNASEGLPDGEPAPNMRSSELAMNMYARNLKDCLLEAQQWSQANEQARRGPTIYQVWRSLIENYMRRELTRGSDRLVAIAGITQAMAEVTGDTFVAGLWSEGLISQLMWHADSGAVDVEWDRSSRVVKVPTQLALMPRLRGGLRRDVVAPSWSWATVGYGISWKHTSASEHLAEVISIDVEKVALGAFRGRIRVRGVLRPARAVTGDLNKP